MLCMTKAQSDARRRDWRNEGTRKRRVEGIRRGALRRYENEDERRKASERTKATMQDPDRKRAHTEHLNRLNKSRRGKPAGALGMSKSPEYRIWSTMVQRCHNPKAEGFQNYGGRGIIVCDEWRGRGGFARFLKHVGRRPTPQHTIERIDNDRGYEPWNVRWATRLEQGANSRKNRLITIDGKTKHLTEWAREAGISAPTLSYRIKAGWPEFRWLDPPSR